MGYDRYGFMNLNQSAHGDRRVWVYYESHEDEEKSSGGHWQDKNVLKRIRNMGGQPPAA
jgi:L-arabinose isomerase